MGTSVPDDDLDQLLDEVETKYCGPGAPRASYRAGERVKPEPSSAGNVLVKASNDDENIDDLIEDILNVNCDGEMKEKQNKSANQHSSHVRCKKCCPAYVGGSDVLLGLGTNIYKRACDQLRCTVCDFKIVLFDDYKWEASCDYLFFRNNMPELSKLQSKMIKKKGTRAYACQCSWRSVQNLMDLREDQQLHWVCGKHLE
ncbi:cilia- and flagella-associated protein 418 [Spea bombifrons]|uniref:cilia- and flagella-associated protein 418 n=1 Tax=Spea bombifrons TaxID=233779 RepID=UPI00234B46B6|nr:cilia- and flagella-associated protein 418 [Spea bombifrons]